MFDLEQAIADWRRQMAAGGIKSTEVLDELESHLRDDIEEQLRSGTDAKKAFDSATLHLGKAKEIETEFAKLKGANDRHRSRFTQALCLTSALFVLLVNTWTLVEFELSALEFLMGFCAVAVVTLYLASLPFLGRSLSRGNYARLLGVIKLASLLVALLPIGGILSACNIIRFEIGIVPTLVIWLLFAAAAISAFVFGYGGDHGWGDGSSGPGKFWPSGPQSIPPGFPPDFGLSLPPPTKFAPIARKSLEAAREEASRLGHDFVGTEHVLLGALKLARGSVAAILQNSNVDCAAVQGEIERLVAVQSPQLSAAALPLTPRARKALRIAEKEAKTHHQSLVNIEHILVGLLLEGSGVAAVALKNLGVRIERMREEISKASARTRSDSSRGES